MKDETKCVADSPRKAFVFIVEDEADIREALQCALEDAGYKVLAAEDGRDALDLLDQIETLPDLIICNVMMPRLNGWELLDILRAENSRFVDVPALVLSAESDSHKLPSGIARARKPISLVALLALVAGYTHRDAPHRAAPDGEVALSLTP